MALQAGGSGTALLPRLRLKGPGVLCLCLCQSVVVASPLCRGVLDSSAYPADKEAKQPAQGKGPLASHSSSRAVNDEPSADGLQKHPLPRRKLPGPAVEKAFPQQGEGRCTPSRRRCKRETDQRDRDVPTALHKLCKAGHPQGLRTPSCGSCSAAGCNWSLSGDFCPLVQRGWWRGVLGCPSLWDSHLLTGEKGRVLRGLEDAQAREVGGIRKRLEPHLLTAPCQGAFGELPRAGPHCGPGEVCARSTVYRPCHSLVGSCCYSLIWDEHIPNGMHQM